MSLKDNPLPDSPDFCNRFISIADSAFRVQQRFALLMDSFIPQPGQIASQDHRLKRNL
jgi:hypothetical protein